jgi:hypothetical protein
VSDLEREAAELVARLPKRDSPELTADEFIEAVRMFDRIIGANEAALKDCERLAQAAMQEGKSHLSEAGEEMDDALRRVLSGERASEVLRRWLGIDIDEREPSIIEHPDGTLALRVLQEEDA